MQSPTTRIRSWPALLLGLFFAGVTARVLLDDVVGGQPFTITHLGSIAALVAALGAGHFCWPALRQGALLSGVILLLVAVGATGYVVVSAGMRNAETAKAKTETASKAGDDRREAEATWKRLAAEMASLGTPRSTQAVRAAMDAVVGKGEGKVPVRIFTGTAQCTDITRPASAEACRPLLDLRVEMAAAIRKVEIEPKVAAARQRLEAMQPVVAPSAGYAHAARVLAVLSCAYECVGEETIQGQLELLMPFASVVIGEMGTLGFLYLGLGHRPAQRRTVAMIQAANGPDAAPAGRSAWRQSPANSRKSAIMSAGPSGKHTGPSGGRSAGKSREEAEADLLTLLALGQSVPSQRTLAQRWHRPKQTVSDWLQAWEADGIIPARRQVGREKMVAGTAAKSIA